MDENKTATGTPVSVEVPLPRSEPRLNPIRAPKYTFLIKRVRNGFKLRLNGEDQDDVGVFGSEHAAADMAVCHAQDHDALYEIIYP